MEDEEQTEDLSCVICGCTEKRGCRFDASSGMVPGSCWWVTEEPLCSNPECMRGAGYTEEEIRTAWEEEGFGELLEDVTKASAAGPKTSSGETISPGCETGQED